jgi:hypothetical protein
MKLFFNLCSIFIAKFDLDEIERIRVFLWSFRTLHHSTTVRSSSRERSLQLNGYVISSIIYFFKPNFPLDFSARGGSKAGSSK